jgi:hypothetical protein
MVIGMDIRRKQAKHSLEGHEQSTKYKHSQIHKNRQTCVRHRTKMNTFIGDENEHAQWQKLRQV